MLFGKKPAALDEKEKENTRADADVRPSTSTPP